MATQKTLSTGTLSLKFMQNAQRAKQQQQVELERAAVKDEAEWEVPSAVRQAWGLPERSNAIIGDPQAAVCDSSYMPFMYGSSSVDDDEPGPSRPRGRRTFNKKGEEVSSEQPEEIPAKPSADSGTSPPKGKMYARPSSISLSSSKAATSGKSSKKADKSVFSSSRDAIFGFNPTGTPAGISASKSMATTLSGSVPSKTQVAAKGPPAFLKPAGVDAPSSSTVPVPSSADSAAGGARKEKKPKRARKEADLDSKSESPKKKKKKQPPA